VLVLKYGAALVGVVLLVLLYRRHDKVRAGLLPAPERREPTAPFTPGASFLLPLVFYAGGILFLAALVRAKPGLGKDLVFRMAGNSAILLPIALAVVVKRARLLHGRGPGPRAAFLGGLKTYFVASAVVLPTYFVVMGVFTLMGRELTVYGPVVEVVRSSDLVLPIAVAFFAVVVAPFTEECVFRGLLYPAVRSLGGGGPRGRRLAVVVVSLLFAVIHWHDVSLLPLFALAVVLALAFELTDSLAVVVVAHGLWNLTSLLPVLLRKVA
jgi:membrane protease YdiL (CAAX protease family)